MQVNIFCDGRTKDEGEISVPPLAENVLRLCDVRYLQDDCTPLDLPEDAAPTAAAPPNNTAAPKPPASDKRKHTAQTAFAQPGAAKQQKKTTGTTAAPTQTLLGKASAQQKANAFHSK